MSVKYNVRLLDKAKEDIRNVYQYIFDSSASIKYANNIISEIEKAIKYLEQNPRIYPESKKQGYRKCVVKNYVIMYCVVDVSKKVLITRVFGGAQDYEGYF